MLVKEGLSFAFVYLLISGILLIYYIQQATKGKVPHIRSIPGLEAIKEVIRRSVEMGKPV
ncbi:unnamed protein product, partial [marine sediment metagenome]